MPYIYSTLSNDNEYPIYENGGADVKVVKKSIRIKGGANVANKNLITPLGVMTEVTAAELAELEKNEVFITQKAAGFITVDNKKTDADNAAKNMTKEDKSAPATPEHYEEKKKPAPKTNSRK